MKLRKLLASIFVGVMTVSALAVSASAGYVEVTDEFDPSGEYKAQMFIQFGDTYIFRDPLSNDASSASGNYAGADKLTTLKGTEVEAEYEGTFNDVELKGNGTYTVSLTDVGDLGDTKKINLLGLSTNIPSSAADQIKFTDVTITINDSKVLSYTYPEGTIDEDCIDNNSYINVLGVNGWNSEVCTDANAAIGDESVWPGTITKAEITFTISGFDYDNPDAVAPSEEETTPEETAAPTQAADKNDATTAAAKDSSDSNSNTGLIIGIVAVVVVVVIIVVAVVASKKKKNK